MRGRRVGEPRQIRPLWNAGAVGGGVGASERMEANVSRPGPRDRCFNRRCPHSPHPGVLRRKWLLVPFNPVFITLFI